MKIDNGGIWIAIVLLGILLVGGYIYYSSAPVVSAQGSSNIKVQPDEATVYIGVETRGSDAKTAKDKNNEITDKVTSELIKLGFTKQEIQTSSFNVYQEYDYLSGRSVPKGFVANHQIVVETNDFDKVSDIVDAAIDSGAIVWSINFELSDEKQSENKVLALEAASKDAKKKAEATAQGLGKDLGRLVSVGSEQYNYMPFNYYQKEMVSGGAVSQDEARSAALSISPRDLEVSASVQVTYKLSAF